jgi:hypothetical protein
MGQQAIMFKTDKGPEHCWIYWLGWDDATDAVKVIARCPKPPVAVVDGSGLCAEHLYDRMQGWWSDN